MSQLVHIIKAEIAPASNLSCVVSAKDMKCSIKTEPNWEILPQKGLVGVKIENAFENGQTVYTTTATLLCRMEDVRTARRKVFRLTSVDGRHWLIGSGSRPYPIIKVSRNFPEQHTDSWLERMTITWKAPYPMLEIIG